MEISQPIDSLPPSARPRSKYAPVWTAVVAAAGKWVPVTCESLRGRNHLQSATWTLANHGKQPPMQTKIDCDGVTLYIRLACTEE